MHGLRIKPLVLLGRLGHKLGLMQGLCADVGRLEGPWWVRSRGRRLLPTGLQLIIAGLEGSVGGPQGRQLLPQLQLPPCALLQRCLHSIRFHLCSIILLYSIPHFIFLQMSLQRCLHSI